MADKDIPTAYKFVFNVLNQKSTVRKQVVIYGTSARQAELALVTQLKSGESLSLVGKVAG